MWRLSLSEEFKRRLKQFGKKHPDELAAMLDNLDTYLQTLQAGVNPMQIRHGFIHRETHGAIAIDQKGAKGKPKQTRLYVYPDPTSQILYAITIGDKQSQRDDNSTCRELIVSLREQIQETKESNNQGETPHEHDEQTQRE